MKKSGNYDYIPFEKLLNTKAWKITSLYVRMKAKGICFTCKGKYPMEKLVAGHYIEKRGNAGTYFDLDNLRGQCGWNCNRQLHGNKTLYALYLQRELGLGIIEELHKRASKSKKWTREELDIVATEREKLLKEMG